MSFFPKPEPWMLDAACARIDMELWFPDRGDTRAVREAKSVCKGCPVVSDCLAYALQNNERFGVWGMTTERERRKLQGRGYPSERVA